MTKQAACSRNSGGSYKVEYPAIDKNKLKLMRPASARLLAAYGLGGTHSTMVTVADMQEPIDIAPAGLTLLTGSSGSGKTSLARVIEKAMPFPSFGRPRLPAADLPIIDAWDNDPATNADLLSLVGLADAFSWARTPDELSEGQKHRLMLAMALSGPEPAILLDDFAAPLDRPTARALAWTLHRALTTLGKGALVITTRDDIADDLRPELILRTSWQGPVTHTRPTTFRQRCTEADRVTYRIGSMKDYYPLKPLHYMAGNPATVHSVHVLDHPEIHGPAAVAIVSWPDMHSAARNLLMGNRYNVQRKEVTTAQLNRDVLKLSRIIVTPELRGTGLTRRLLQEMLPTLGCRWLECTTALGRYSPFLLNLGFREVPAAVSKHEGRLIDFCEANASPDHAALDPELLQDWADTLSVRKRREARRLVWRVYHHLVLHRQQRSPAPKTVPAAADDRWQAAWDVAARRLHDRPAYYALGPLDPTTGMLSTDADDIEE